MLRQHGVIALAQLIVLGLTASAVRKRAAAGHLHRVHRAVYSLMPPALLSVRGQYMAAVLACGPDAVLSHRSAADLLGLRASARAAVDVTVSGRAPRRHARIDIHRSGTLRPADVIIIDGIPCTTVARTLLDMSGILLGRQVDRALDQAEILEKLDDRALDEQVGRNRCTAAAHRLREARERHVPNAGTTWSELEADFLALCRGIEVPAPEVNAWIDPDDGEPALRVDFVWRAQRVAVETDGHRFHRTRRAFEDDRRRDQRLSRAGWHPLRVTWRQLSDEAERVADTLMRLLRR